MTTGAAKRSHELGVLSSACTEHTPSSIRRSDQHSELTSTQSTACAYPLSLTILLCSVLASSRFFSSSSLADGRFQPVPAPFLDPDDDETDADAVVCAVGAGLISSSLGGLRRASIAARRVARAAAAVAAGSACSLCSVMVCTRWQETSKSDKMTDVGP